MPATKIPLYRQTAGFSCGAACLVMALAALEDLEPSRPLEIALWRDGTMVGVRGMDQWGLAVAALERDVPATVIATAEHTFPRRDPEAFEARRRELAERYPEDQLPTFTAEDLELAWTAQQDNRRRADEQGVAWHQRAPGVEDLASALDQGAVPIVLVDLERLGGGWPAPHWVVASEVRGDRVALLDPDDAGPGLREKTVDELLDAMDVSAYDAEPTVVVLGDWEPGS